MRTNFQVSLGFVTHYTRGEGNQKERNHVDIWSEKFGRCSYKKISILPAPHPPPPPAEGTFYFRPPTSLGWKFQGVLVFLHSPPGISRSWGLGTLWKEHLFKKMLLHSIFMRKIIFLR